ncbi:unnamed protein product [Nezara viridula]|uniref:Cytosol aminopeptidase n=1 Tax=Nezara viridula TaxID=85310 RepID=A0A9P0H0X7_NEZVI|nr:unnamed protein product [Nezara viridula]
MMKKNYFLKNLQVNPWLESRRGVAGRKGLVIGAYETCTDGEYKLTPEGEKLNGQIQGKLTELLKDSGIKFGKAALYHGICDYYSTVIAGLGLENTGYNETEVLYENRENIRWAAAQGVLMQQNQDVSCVCMDPMGCPEAAAEGSKLANWSYQELRDPENRIPHPDIDLLANCTEGEKEGWFKGCVMADGQNVARTLEDIPANIMTPKFFAEEAIRILCPCGVHVSVRNMKWIEDQRMFAFLNMAKGSCEPPYFLEINYCGGSETDRPVLLIGKGVTFDSGGICLKTCIPQETYTLDMADYRGAMNGAAVVVGTIKSLARLGIPINVVGLIPLFENMPSGSALKPGDVVLTLKGKTIVVEDTDNEGRLALADALAYSEHFQPCLDVTIGNLAPGGKWSLGSGATPVFSSSQIVWDEMKKAGSMTGDRVWRFPLWKQYVDRVRMCKHVDMCNTGKGFPTANSCLAAGFLSEFVPDCDFVHLDTAGTGMKTRGLYAPYLRGGFMTGRPVRTVVQFLINMACPLDSTTKCSK